MPTERSWLRRLHDGISAYLDSAPATPASEPLPVAPPASWWDRNIKPYYQAVEVIISITCLVGAFTASDLMFAMGLVVVGYAFALAAVWTLSGIPSVTHRWVWSIPVTMLFALSAYVIFERHPPATKQPAVNPAVQANLQEINEWLCPKDEMALRNEFDLVPMLETNISTMTANHSPLNEKRPDFATVFMDPAKIVFNRPMSPGSKLYVKDWNVKPGYIGYIVTSDQYRLTIARLAQYYGSATTPANVKTSLQGLKALTDYDMLGMITELELAYKQDPRYIFDSDKAGTPYFATVRDRFLAHMVPMRPQVDRVCQQISDDLQHDTD